MEQHCEVQQQLLQHVFVEKHFGEAGGDEDYQERLFQDDVSENGYGYDVSNANVIFVWRRSI